MELSRPLSDAVICCTGIPPEQRDQLEGRIHQMGGVHRLDLTAEVTHLIVGKIVSEKYRYVARYRPEVRVMDARWIEALRAAWIEDSTVRPVEIEREHILQTFTGLQICLTGLEDLEERQRVAELVVRNGARYHGDLSPIVTHLIACKAEGSKYNAASQWGLTCVTLEWLYDSLERGMILEEALYNPLMPKDQRGRDAWFRQPATSSHLGKRQRSEGGDKDDGRDLFTDRRKLRRTVSSKHSEQSSKVWNDIASHSVDPRQSSEAVPLVLRSMSARSEDPAVKARDSEGLAQARHDPTKDRNPIHSMKLLDGQAFFIHGFDAKRASIIKRHLGSHGAVVYTDPRESVDKAQRTYLLVPHDLCASDAARQGVELVKNEFVKSTVVTDWWLEKCLESKTIMRRSAVPGGVPFAGFPLSGIAKMKITCTGYLNTDLMHVSKMTALAGARYSGNLEDDTTILLCNPANMLRGDKIKHAWRTGIPTVSGRWLSESLASARMLDTAPYLLQEPNQRSPRKGLPRSEMASRLEGREAQRAKLSSRENQLREKPSVLLTDGLRSPSSKLRVARNSRAVHASTSTEVPPSKPADSHEQNPTGAEKRGSHEIAQGKGKPKILPHQGESGPLLSPKLANSTEHTEHVPAKKTVQLESGSSAEIQHDKPGPGLNDEISSLLAYQTARRLQRTASELTAATGSPSKNIQGLSRTNSEVLTSQNSPSKSHRRKLFGKARNGSSSIEGASFSTFATAKSTVSESTPAVPSLSSKTSEQFAMDLGWGVDEEPQKPTLPPPTQQLVYDDPEAKRHRERVQRKAAQARNRADKDQAGDDAVNGAMWEKVVSPRRPMLAVDSVGPAATAGQGRAGKTSRRRQTRSACQVAG